jgi:nitrous oxidase accessory protein NosD
MTVLQGGFDSMQRINAQGPPRLAVAAVATLALAAAAPGLASASPRGYQHGQRHPHAARTLYVSPRGSDSGRCTSRRPCKTIGHAVAVAAAGDVVMVRRGTYNEQVTVAKRLRLIGVGHPTINATGEQNGIVITGPGSAHSMVRGFVVENAAQEGILAMRTAWVTVSTNVVRHNDLGAAAQHPTGECAPQGQVPGDCGEGVHLMTVAHSAVLGNRVTQNTGGILLTDELGPTYRNLVAANAVHENPFDCGITVAGHNSKAVVNGTVQPRVAGIYENTIADNVSNRNGLRGEGAGVLLATAGPGTAVYSNVIRGNRAAGNNLAGITLHSHAPGDDLNGNKIIGNSLRNDNVGGDPDAGDTETTGILIFSAATTLKGTVVRRNRIADTHFGIWTQNVPTIPTSANRFSNVAVPVFQK